MKKNIFKFAYIALAVVTMIVLGQGRAYASTCSEGCSIASLQCEESCVSSGANDPSCVDGCQQDEADCRSACPVPVDPA
jgi:hypothetical protein